MNVLLKTHDLCRRFGGLVVTDHVNLAVEANEIHALIGPNGAGKTSLIAQLSGTLRADSGTIFLADSDITTMPSHARVTQGLARSFQTSSLFNNHSMLANIALAVQARSGSSFRFWQPVASESELFEQARNLLVELGLTHREQVHAADLAHGEQRQLEIALALATKPNVLLLDEPMAGLSGEDSARMVAFIRSLKGKLTILLVEHDMDAVFQLADRISVLVAGRIIATGTPNDVRQNSEVRHAYLGDGPHGTDSR